MKTDRDSARKNKGQLAKIVMGEKDGIDLFLHLCLYRASLISYK